MFNTYLGVKYMVSVISRSRKRDKKKKEQTRLLGIHFQELSKGFSKDYYYKKPTPLNYQIKLR